MPTINKRFLLAILVATAAFTGALFAVHAVQTSRLPDALKAQAERAADGDHADKAAKYYRQYLEFRPADVDAQEKLADLIRARQDRVFAQTGKLGGDAADLLLLYDKILRLDPARHPVRKHALVLCLRMARYTDADTHAADLLKQFPEDADLWQMQAAAHAGLQRPADAVQSYETAIARDPAAPLPYQRLAQFLWRDAKKPAAAAAVLDRLVAAIPHEAEPYLTRARFRLFTGDVTPAVVDGAMADLRTAMEIDPENADALLLMAEQLQKRRQLPAARDCLVAGVKLYPQDVKFVRALAWHELNRGNLGAAVAVLEDGLARMPAAGGFELLVPLGDLLVQLGETKKAEDIVTRLSGRPGAAARMQVTYLTARVAMRQQRWADAIAKLTELRTETTTLPGLDAQANLLIAVCHQRTGDPKAEQDALKLILNTDPKHLAARQALAQAYLNAGRFADAEGEYEQVVQSAYAGPQAHATLVRLKAARLVSAGNLTGPEWQRLEQVAKDLTAAFGPASSESTLLRAELAADRGDRTTAVAILRAEATRRPGDARLWAALASATADVAGVAAGLGVLDEAQAATGDGVVVRLARADLYARDPAGLRPLEPLGANIDGWADPDQVRLLFGLMEVCDRLGDDAGVIRMYQRIATRRPGDAAVWEALADRAADAGDAATLATASVALSRLPDVKGAKELAAAWTALATKTPSPQAVAGLKQVFGAAPDRAEACVVLGKLLALGGDADGATALYERAVRIEPTRFGPMRQHLADLAKSGRPDRIRTALTRLAFDYRWAGEPFRRTVRGAATRVSADAAKTLLTAAIPFVEKQPGGIGWAGDCFLAAKLPGDAAVCFRNATAAPTTTADDWLRLAARSPDAASATQVMRDAQAKLPAGLFLVTAAAFAETPNGKAWSPALATADASRQYAQARLSLQLSRYQRAEAIALLEGFLAGKDVPPVHAGWAKRNLAMLLVVRGQPDDRTKAMALLNSTDAGTGDTADEKRATAAVLTALARYLDGPDRTAVLNRAIGVLDGLVRKTNEPRDGFLLAQVYRAAGHRAAGWQMLQNLLNVDSKNLDFLVFGLDELLETDNIADARPFADRLLSLYPTDYRAVASVARYEARAGKPDRAMVLAEGYARTADNTNGDLPARSARAAELLDELSRMPGVKGTPAAAKMVAAAAERYEALVPSRPEVVAAAAGMLSAAGRTNDAFAVIEKHAGALTPRLKLAAGLAALRAGGTDRQFAIVNDWLTQATAADPAAVGVMLNAGEFLALKGDQAGAAAAYQKVLDADPRNVVALNNLAWLLAPDPATAGRALALVTRAVAEIGLTGELLDTRARVRIAAREFDLAEKDLKDALAQEQTPLRLFHAALAKQSRSPADAKKTFAAAKARGLDAKSVHPADLPLYRALDAQ